MPDRTLAEVAPPRIEYREEPCKSALSRVRGMHFTWSLNPYMGCAHRCTFCYVRAFERRADRPSGEAYGRSIRVKTNIVAVLDAEVHKRSWRHETVALGSATDPYQPAEGRYRLTRGCIEVLARSRTPFEIITRGPLVVRDIDVLREAAARVPVTVNLSVPTLDEHVWRNTEPGTAPPRQRLRAVRMLVGAGIRAGVGMAPVLPGLSDRPDQLLEVVRAAHDAGATHLWTRTLYLGPGTREHFLDGLSRVWPEEAVRYASLYRTAYLDRSVEQPIRARVERLSRAVGIADRRTHPIEAPPPDHQVALL
ncbi:MAG: radical SAM protein [Dehalococcoidia bacterium]|nr:MAG: radical SAM protein [Dehalococcoidia bacterium]